MDLSWKPLLGFSNGQLKWAETLGLNKNITVQMIDDCGATVAGMMKLPSDLSRAEGFPICSYS